MYTLHLVFSILTFTLSSTKLLASTVMKEFLDWEISQHWEQSIKMGKG